MSRRHVVTEMAQLTKFGQTVWMFMDVGEFSHIRQSDISLGELKILTSFRYFRHCIHFWNISQQDPQLWYLWTALLKPSVVANWRNNIWITTQDNALNDKNIFSGLEIACNSFFYYHFGKILQFMKKAVPLILLLFLCILSIDYW